MIKKTISLAHKKVGPDGKCFIIAEVAQAHDGSLGMAHSFIDAVAQTGADAIKFQTHFASEESTLREPWRIKFSYADKTRYDYWKRMEFSPEEWNGLSQHAQDKGLIFLSSPFSLKAVDLLEKLGVPAWKVGSGEVDNYPLLDRIIKSKKPILLSTGMSTWHEIEELHAYIVSRGSELALFHCTSQYPVPMEKVGLNNIVEFQKRFDCPIGFSSHIPDIVPCLGAISLGAKLLEVHVTFDRSMFGPDSSSSLTLLELKELVRSVRLLGEIFQNPVSKDQVALELERNRQIFGKSIVAKMPLAEGTVLGMEHVALKKPGDGLRANKLPEVLGRSLKIGKALDEVILPEDLI